MNGARWISHVRLAPGVSILPRGCQTTESSAAAASSDETSAVASPTDVGLQSSMQNVSWLSTWSCNIQANQIVLTFTWFGILVAQGHCLYVVK